MLSTYVRVTQEDVLIRVFLSYCTCAPYVAVIGTILLIEVPGSNLRLFLIFFLPSVTECARS